MKKRYLLLLLLGGGGLAVFLYNYWSYSCGRCDAESLRTISAPARILIGFNLLGLIVLILAKLWRRDRTSRPHCACGEVMHSSWQFCPHCGHAH